MISLLITQLFGQSFSLYTMFSRERILHYLVASLINLISNIIFLYITQNFISGSVSHEVMGIPCWEKVADWLVPFFPERPSLNTTPVIFKLKCPEVPTLTRYDWDPGSKFWGCFPHRELPIKPATKVNIVELEKMVSTAIEQGKFSPSQVKRAKHLVANLKNGAPSHQKANLPSCYIPNAKSTLAHGREVTDAVAYWVKNGYVAGPFKEPPLDRFRVNPIIAVEQEDKVRAVLNVSNNTGESFNNNVNKLMLKKVQMSSARNFGYTIRKCGANAKMSKFDLEAAYKQMPAPINELRLQGFCWLNRFFVELDQTFGAISAVANFDQLGHTKVDLAVIFSDIRLQHFLD